jgi:hypothetical protein
MCGLSKVGLLQDAGQIAHLNQTKLRPSVEGLLLACYLKPEPANIRLDADSWLTTRILTGH